MISGHPLRLLLATLLVAMCGMTSVFASSGAESSKSLWIDAAKNGIVTASSGLDIAPATFVRDVAKGEKFGDLLHELKGLQFQGVEANLVRMKGGGQKIFTGGFDGTNWNAIADQIHSVRLHTHPNITGPSRVLESTKSIILSQVFQAA